MKYNTMQVGCKEAKGRLMQSAEQFWAGRETDQVGMDTLLTSFPQMEEWLLARARVGEKYHYTGPREEPRPSSAASVDRRRQRRRAASECKPIQSELLILNSYSNLFPQTLKLGRVFPGWGGEVPAQTEHAGRGIQRASSRSSSSSSIASRGTSGARTAGCPALTTAPQAAGPAEDLEGPSTGVSSDNHISLIGSLVLSGVQSRLVEDHATNNTRFMSD